jgi:hypothetical protein
VKTGIFQAVFSDKKSESELMDKGLSAISDIRSDFLVCNYRKFYFNNFLTGLGGLGQLKTAAECFQICSFIEQLGRQVKAQSHSMKEFKGV